LEGEEGIFEEMGVFFFFKSLYQQMKN
jgi:hypothetical protein